MTILALDLGTRTGWAIAAQTFAGSIEYHMTESGVQVFDVKRGESPGMRYQRFSRWIEEVWLGIPGAGSREERAWAAGFFDGEGCTGCYPRDNGHPNGSWSLTIQIPQVFRPSLERFMAAVGGLGEIHGPLDIHEPNRQPLYRYRVTKLDTAVSVLDAIWPWLGAVKREQAEKAIGEKLTRTVTWPKRPRPGLIVYEAAHHRGGAATEIAAGLATRVQEFCARHRIEHASVHSATLKKATTGKGNADKAAMLEAVAKRWKAVESDDEADAIALLHFAIAELVPSGR